MSDTVVHFIGGDAFGGLEQIVLTLLAGLDVRRWRPVLLHHPEPALDAFLEAARRTGVKTVAVPRLAGAPARRRIQSLLRALRAERPMIFHAHLSVPQYSGLALAAAALARVPVIVATEQLFQCFTSRSSLLLQQLLSVRVNCYIAVSSDVAAQLRRTVGVPARKIRVIHNAIPLENYDRSPDPVVRRQLTGGKEAPVILTTARLHEQKGIEFLIEAAAKVPRAVFVVAGDGPLRGMLETQCRRAGLAERVIFLGHRSDIPALLAASDIFVLPSLYEGLPLSVLEAMAAAKPVVATSVGGTPEILPDGEAGILVPPRDPGALACAIQRILSDTTFASRLGANARETVRANFSAEGMVQRISDVYEEFRREIRR